MTSIITIIFYILVGTAGGFIGWRLKFSGGVIIGSMLAVIIFKLLTQKHVGVPSGLQFFIQVMIGFMVGMSFNMGILPQIKNIIWPVCMSIIILMAAGLITTFIIAKMDILDIPTAYIATSPGAMNTLIGLAIARGANTTLVVAFHMFRLMIVNISSPFIFALLSWWFKK